MPTEVSSVLLLHLNSIAADWAPLKREQETQCPFSCNPTSLS